MKQRLIIPGFVLFLFFLLVTTQHLYAGDVTPADPTALIDALQIQQQRLQQMTVQTIQSIHQTITTTQAISAVDISLLREVLPTPRPNVQKGKRDVLTLPFASQCLVTRPADSGVGTLRHCLLTATPGVTITFDAASFPPTDPVSITLQMALPIIITDHVTIDASNAGVILNGSQLAKNSYHDGLVIDGAHEVTIYGLHIAHFSRAGILLQHGTTNSIIGGHRNMGNSPIGQGNLLTANELGIVIADTRTSHNQVFGNNIGTDATSEIPFGNQYGIIISSGATANFIGGGTPNTRNLISGNQFGIVIESEITTDNQVVGNYIGTNEIGNKAIGNIEAGIAIVDAADNVIGGGMPGSGNLIGGNGIGIIIHGVTATDNRVLGNYIGIDISGTYSLSNNYGVAIINAHRNVIGGIFSIERNFISGNREVGVIIENRASGNHVIGNYIGTTVNGEQAVGNSVGVAVSSGAHHNLIGGERHNKGNLISGNEDSGVLIQETDTTANQILGNYIGTDPTGTMAIGNGESGIGIKILPLANGNIVGGTEQGSANLISGHSLIGILLGSNHNLVQGNWIGVEKSGQFPLSNGVGVAIVGAQNHIGGPSSSKRNLISGNDSSGISISASDAYSNTVEGNYIGVNVSGTHAVSNGIGIEIYGDTYGNQIGGEAADARNLISGNEQFGVMIHGDEIQPQLVASRNVIKGNWIGIDAGGQQPLGNGNGIALLDGSIDNLVGGLLPGSGNLISGNHDAGIVIVSDTESSQSIPMNNQLLGNQIGVDSTGKHSIGNNFGVLIGGQARRNQVGSMDLGGKNLISGNKYAGVVLLGKEVTQNQVINNSIGVDSSHSNPIPNTIAGVALLAGTNNNLIGVGNTIAYNGNGIVITGTTTLRNTITQNTIYSNAEAAIFADPVVLSAPQLSTYDPSTQRLSGQTCPGCLVEIFANPTITLEGMQYLGKTKAQIDGTFSLTIVLPNALPFLTATATDLVGTTSAFATLNTQSRLIYLPLVAR